jgi:tetratricopeptide (TPR) repeat protein
MVQPFATLGHCLIPGFADQDLGSVTPNGKPLELPFRERAKEASRLGEARALYEEALALMEAVRDNDGTLWVTTNLGELELHDGDYRRAEEHLEEAVSLAEAADLAQDEPPLLSISDSWAILEDDPVAAAEHLHQALEIASRVGVPYLLAGCSEGPRDSSHHGGSTRHGRPPLRDSGARPPGLDYMTCRPSGHCTNITSWPP